MQWALVLGGGMFLAAVAAAIVDRFNLLRLD